MLLNGVGEHGQHARGDVVGAGRHGLRPGLRVEPGVLRYVAGEEPVPGAADALGPQGPAQPPRRPPRPLQDPGGEPQQRHGRRACKPVGQVACTR